MTKVCEICGAEFETKNPQKKYCNNLHFLPCPICGKLVPKKDKNFAVMPKCCSSECSHKLRQSHISERSCKICGKMFRPTTGSQIICSNVHYDNCEICGKPFVQTLQNIANSVTTCSNECTQEKMRKNSKEKYHTDHPMQNDEVKTKFKVTRRKGSSNFNKPIENSIFARNCEVWRIRSDVADKFLEKNCIEGTAANQLLCLGLVYEGQLLQLMTFGKSIRDKDHYVEMMRMCSKQGWRIVGGASKLFSYATSEYGLYDIIAYSDSSIFRGDVYSKLGMKLIHQSGYIQTYWFE